MQPRSTIPPVPLRILLAEDNEVNQKVALRMLTRLGYEADLVTNGAEALRAVEAVRYDLILMDLHMPLMGGVEATIAIRKKNLLVQPVIVALTASATSTDRDLCFRAGMNGYLCKPISIDQLRDTLQDYVIPVVQTRTPSTSAT